MSDNDWDRLKDIVADALERDPADRSVWLDEVCGAESALRQRVDRLLGLEQTASDFLERGAEVDLVREAVPQRVGRYRILRRIAAGGAGTVYEAEQTSPSRTVAVKLLRPDALGSGLARRFEREGEVLAHLHHPGIAHVYEAGVHEHGGFPVPYIAMELVPEAHTIVAYAENRLEVAQSIKLIIDVCRAVQHGHDRGIVHRDLKPPNVLVGADGLVKVVDFGVARVQRAREGLDQTIETSAGDLVGTLPYMSPEQCGSDPEIVGVGADIYALGVILFDLLANQLPIQLAGLPLDEAVDAIRHQMPLRLGRVAPHLGRDLDAITAKALAKEPERRYSSAAALAADLQRYLDHQPIVARPPSLVYQARLFAARHRFAVAISSIAVAALIFATILSAVFAVQAGRSAESEARQRATVEHINTYLHSLLSLPDPHQRGETVTVLELLARVTAQLDHDRDVPAEVEGAVRRTIAGTYLNLQRHEEAQKQTLLALKAYEAIDPISDDTVTLNSMLGVVRFQSGDLSGAAQAYDRALELSRALDSPREDLATLLGNYASVLMADGRLAEAEPIVRESLAIYRATLGPEHVSVIGGIRQLARVKLWTGDADDAEQLLREALAIATRVLEESHPMHPAIHGEIAQTLAVRGRSDEGLPLVAEQWRLLDRYQSPGTPDWMVTCQTYATVLAAFDRHEEALAMIDAAIARVSERLGENDYRVAALRSHRAVVESTPAVVPAGP